MASEVLVLDDFLPEDEFKVFEDFIMGTEFEWYWSDGQAEIPQKDRYMFNHMFFCHIDGINSRYYEICRPVMQKLWRSGNKMKVVRIKANLTTQSVTPEGSGYHTDYKNITTAIHYINTNNGYTEFKDGGIIESVRNRMIIFDSNLFHQGVSNTDDKRRVVVNYNYETKSISNRQFLTT